jgi:hypothetical protein
LPVPNVVGQDGKSPSLRKLHRAIDEIVVRHYSKATSQLFEQIIGFEFASRIYVARLVSKRLSGMDPLIGCERGQWTTVFGVIFGSGRVIKKKSQPMLEPKE